MLISLSFSSHEKETNANEVPVITEQPKMSGKKWVSQIEPSIIVENEACPEMLGAKEMPRDNYMISQPSSSMPLDLSMKRNFTNLDSRESTSYSKPMTDSKITGKFCDKLWYH